MILALIACGNPTGSFTAMTYNAGLAVGFVPASEDRAATTAEAVASVGADLVCVQEFWLDDHVDLLTAATGYSETFLPAPNAADGGGVGCSAEDLESLLTCADAACGEVCDDKVVECVFSSCPIQFLSLEVGCQGCVMANVGGSVAAAEAACTEANPTYSYDGAFGTGILTDYEMLETEEVLFESTTSRRSLLYALVETPLGAAHTFCTHLTPVFELIPYPKETGSWDEEQAKQISEMRAFIDETAGDEPVLLLGDMNTGPGVGDVPAEAIDNYSALIAGYTNPYVEGLGGCTYCGDNALNGADDSESGVIDHVLLRGWEDVDSSSTRVLDEATEAERCGETIPSAHSDHYGVLSTLVRE